MSNRKDLLQAVVVGAYAAEMVLLLKDGSMGLALCALALALVHAGR